MDELNKRFYRIGDVADILGIPAPKRKVVKKAKKRYNPSPAAKPKTPTPQKKKSTTVSDFKRLIGG